MVGPNVLIFSFGLSQLLIYNLLNQIGLTAWHVLVSDVFMGIDNFDIILTYITYTTIDLDS